jgi:hypothetical protein
MDANAAHEEMTSHQSLLDNRSARAAGATSTLTVRKHRSSPLPPPPPSSAPFHAMDLRDLPATSHVPLHEAHEAMLHSPLLRAKHSPDSLAALDVDALALLHNAECVKTQQLDNTYPTSTHTLAPQSSTICARHRAALRAGTLTSARFRLPTRSPQDLAECLKMADKTPTVVKDYAVTAHGVEPRRPQ